jgi:transcriptional regulator with XRE-family HTH domain
MQESLSEKLRVLRAERGLSLLAASKELGIDRHTLRRVELGIQDPQYPTLAKIAEGYGVPVKDLLEEPALAGSPGKAEAPQETGPSDKEESVLDLVHDAVRRQYQDDAQAARRALAAEGIPQPAYFKHYENTLFQRLLEYPPDEVAGALVEFAMGHVRLEAENTQVKDENARMAEENARLRQDIAELRSEAEREDVRR